MTFPITYIMPVPGRWWSLDIGRGGGRSVRSCAAVAISGRRRIPRAEPASEPKPALVRRVLVIAWSLLPAEEPDCGRGADHEDSDENACLE